MEGEVSFDEDLMMSLRKLKEERTQVRVIKQHSSLI